jgi:clan AA aspartic protease
MGMVYAEIELINSGELQMARRYMIGEEEIKRVQVTMMVDSGSYFMSINENVREQLQLAVIEKRKFRMANEEVREFEVVGPIEVRFKNRRCVVDALVLPGSSELLLGAIPMEALDVLIHPLRQEMIVNPESEDCAIAKLKSFPPRRRSA